MVPVPERFHELAPVQFDWIIPPRSGPEGKAIPPVPRLVRQGPVCFRSTIAKGLFCGSAPPTLCAVTGLRMDCAGTRAVRTCLMMTTSTYLSLPANAAPPPGGWFTISCVLFTPSVKPLRVASSIAAWRAAVHGGVCQQLRGDWEI